MHPVGWLRFDEYLETRVVEVVLHTVDIQLACGHPPAAAASSLAVTVPVLVGLSDLVDPLDLVLALSGRSGGRAVSVLA